MKRTLLNQNVFTTIISFLIYCTFNINVTSQIDEASSFYFSNPTTEDSTIQFEQKHCGSYYLNNDTLTKLIITKDSIYLRYFYITAFSKKEIRKSKKLRLENDLIFGIKEGQGLPYEMHNDTAYTVLIQKETFFKNGNGHYLDKINENTYILNYPIDEKHYYVELIEIKEDSLKLRSLEHDEILQDILLKIILNEEKFKGVMTYIALGNKSNLNTLINLNGFSDVINYVKVSTL